MAWVLGVVDCLQIGHTVRCISLINLNDYFNDRGNELSCRLLWKCCLDRRFDRAFFCTEFVFRPHVFRAVYTNEDFIIHIHGWPDRGAWLFQMQAVECEPGCWWCF